MVRRSAGHSIDIPAGAGIGRLVLPLVCCEVNPSPGLTVYQQATGRRIAEAIADLLAVGGGDQCG
jgi:hypothetical protein